MWGKFANCHLFIRIIIFKKKECPLPRSEEEKDLQIKDDMKYVRGSIR